MLYQRFLLPFGHLIVIIEPIDMTEKEMEEKDDENRFSWGFGLALANWRDGTAFYMA